MTTTSITLDIARAAGQDAANRRMAKAGRKSWSRSDYGHAIRVCNDLLRLNPAHASNQ